MPINRVLPSCSPCFDAANVWQAYKANTPQLIPFPSLSFESMGGGASELNESLLVVEEGEAPAEDQQQPIVEQN